ncbi:MAG: hypothetical protein A2252_11250 [Elusimicrobia bacterium RIFOXYA2_FULL_39_19]|nr:MAG: hypothetical protein A2252_11250 [Elusimicrobia bacterium RIFOXYA2_FULL_39_19]
MKLNIFVNKTIVFVIVMFITINNLMSYDNVNTHPRLTKNACNLLSDTYSEFNTENLISGFFEGHEGKNIKQGTIDEDEMALFSFHTRFHFYHAVTGKGWINDTFDNAIVHGEGYWKTALWY